MPQVIDIGTISDDILLVREPLEGELVLAPGDTIVVPPGHRASISHGGVSLSKPPGRHVIADPTGDPAMELVLSRPVWIYFVKEKIPYSFKFGARTPQMMPHATLGVASLRPFGEVCWQIDSGGLFGRFCLQTPVGSRGTLEGILRSDRIWEAMAAVMSVRTDASPEALTAAKDEIAAEVRAKLDEIVGGPSGLAILDVTIASL